uniref:Ubiquitin-like protease family profile domain-containing protein n=2 Tax=Amphimedon queenslandica TaxID=400682 RepID=A0A1X7UD19_AMPQE
LEQGGLEIPFTITFGIGGNDKLGDLEKKAEKLVKSALSTVTSTVQSAETERKSEDGPEPKKRKLDEPRDETIWEYEIRNGHMLTNASFNMAQDVLKKQYPAIKGFISTVDQYQTPAAGSGKQIGGKDCSLFAIAVITAIAHGIDPSKSVFVQDKMRHHLLSCLQNNNITPFPCIT